MRPDDGQGSPFHRLRGIFLEIINLVPGLSDKRRRIAMTLAFRAHQDTFARTGELVSWIGATTLAVALGYDRRTIQRALKQLLEEGIVEVERKGGGRARSTRYRFRKQWLPNAVDLLEKSGRAEAYGLRTDLFSWAYGGTLAAQLEQFSGSGADDYAGNYGTYDAVLSGMGGAGASATGISGTGAALHGQNSGANPGNGWETAANHAVNSGNFAGNSGRAVPPETDLNNRNNTARVSKTATAQNPERWQGHLPLPIAGGRSAAAETKGYPGSERNRGWHQRIVRQAAEILGDTQRAILAVEWLEDGQKERFSAGYLPKGDELERWLGWALDRADNGEADAPPAPAGGLPPDLAQAVQQAAVQAVRDVLPSIVPTLVQALQQQLQGAGAGAAAA